ncbi:MAG TPA: hypothetical protein DEO46_08055, partial [Lachnospiraceae bacterium]|nr:hypothetical protein [Lachnospiraceae bacterium]
LTLVFYLVVERLTGGQLTCNEKAPGAGQQLQRGWKKLFQSPIPRYALILFLCWLPVFLAVYPGFFAYDATDELQEVLTGQYVTRHPLLHVLMLGKTVSGIQKLTGSYNIGIGVYVLVQMAGMAMLLGWTIQQLRTRAGRVCGLLFYGLFPVIPMYVLCTSKDMPYTAGMLAVLVLLCRMQRSGHSRRGESEVAAADAEMPKAGHFPLSTASLPALAFALLVMAVFRSNGVIVLVLFLPILFFLVQKSSRKKAVLLAGVVLGAYVLLQSGLNIVLKPESTNAMESLTVPIQQLARTWNYSPELFLEEDQETLFEILPEESLALYQPKLSDLVKAGFVTENFKKDPAKYAKLWTRIGIKAPATYLNAWLLTSYGFWYPGADIDVYNGTRCYESSSYFSCETEGPGRRDSKLPWLEHWYENLSWTDTVHKIPVVSLPFSPGALCWCYVLGTLFLIASGNWRKAAVFSPVCLNLLTVLLGPTYLVRYVLIFWFALPLYLSICVGVCYTSKDNGKSGKSCVKADKQAAGNLPDGSLFGKAFHESKD